MASKWESENVFLRMLSSLVLSIGIWFDKLRSTEPKVPPVPPAPPASPEAWKGQAAFNKLSDDEKRAFIAERRRKNSEALNAVIDFATAKGCPCAFPRVLKLMTFNPVKEGIGPAKVEFTSELIFGFMSDANGRKPVLVGEGETCRCEICGSTYVLSTEEYSIRMIYPLLTMADMKASQIGSDFAFPIPLPGSVVVPPHINPNVVDSILPDVNDNPTLFVEYMTAMA